MRNGLPRLTILRSMIGVGGVAVMLAAMRWSPVLAVPLGVTLFLSLLRTFNAVERVLDSGATVAGWRTLFALSESFLLIGLILTQALAVFFVSAAVVAVAAAPVLFVGIYLNAFTGLPG